MYAVIERGSQAWEHLVKAMLDPSTHKISLSVEGLSTLHEDANRLKIKVNGDTWTYYLDGLVGPRYAFTPGDEGCYLDGAMGWHNIYRIIELAVGQGMSLNAEDRLAYETYKSNDLDNPSLDEAVSAVCGQGGIADSALEYLQSITHPSMTWEWVDGDLILSLDY